MANYWGVVKGGPFTNKPSQTGSNSPALVGGTGAANCGAIYAIDVENYIAAGNNSYAFGATCAANTGAVTSADTLTVRRAAIPIAAADATRLQMCTTRSSAEITLGGACTGDGAEIHDLMTNIYYIDQQSNQSATYPSLRRKSLVAGPAFQDVEIIPGIEDMQIQLGWDSGESGQAVQYVNPGSAVLGSGGQIVAVRIWLLVRGETTDRQFADSRTYEYGDRYASNGVVNNLNAASSSTKAYKPNDNFRRVLVSRTFFVRNAKGT